MELKWRLPLRDDSGMSLRPLLDRMFRNRIERCVHPEDASKCLWKARLSGQDFQFVDYSASETVLSVFNEINRNDLGIQNFRFSGSPVILDIGAHVGVQSIYLAKRFPSARIRSYEAFDKNFENFQENIRRNGIHNIEAIQSAVTGKGGSFPMVCNVETNTGGSTGWTAEVSKGLSNYRVESVAIDDILADLGRCSLMKIDCEGAEHDILGSSKLLSTVENLIGEFHINPFLESSGFNIEGLLAHTRRSIKGVVEVKSLRMCD